MQNTISIIAVALSILGAVISVSSFVLSRKDKALDDTKEEGKEKGSDIADKKLIEYRLEQVEKKLDKILDILDSYDKEIDERVSKALEQHIKLYHGGNQNG